MNVVAGIEEYLKAFLLRSWCESLIYVNISKSHFGYTVDEVFFGPEVLCPCELWRVDSDGDGLDRLVADGRAPAWSTSAPTVGPSPNPNATPRAWLPLVLR